MAGKTPVDAEALREEVKAKYREVAVDPHGDFHFHTGRPLARRLGYDSIRVDADFGLDVFQPWARAPHLGQQLHLPSHSRRRETLAFLPTMTLH